MSYSPDDRILWVNFTYNGDGASANSHVKFSAMVVMEFRTSHTCCGGYDEKNRGFGTSARYIGARRFSRGFLFFSQSILIIFLRGLARRSITALWYYQNSVSSKKHNSVLLQIILLLWHSWQYSSVYWSFRAFSHNGCHSYN